MSERVTIELKQQAQDLIKRFQNPELALQAIRNAMNFQNALTVSHIQRAYLSFGRGGPANPLGLRVQSGSARRSVRASDAVISNGSVQSAIGGNVTSRGVNYLAVHEFGAHHKARVAVIHFGKADKFGRRKFSTAKEASVALKAKVGAWDAPARMMIRRGIQDRLADYGRETVKELKAALGGVK